MQIRNAYAFWTLFSEICFMFYVLFDIQAQVRYY